MKELWPDEDVNVLLGVVAEKGSAKNCAARLKGRYTRNACIGKARRLGLHFGGYPGRKIAIRTKKPKPPPAPKPKPKPKPVLVEPDFIGPKNDVPEKRLVCRAVKGDPRDGAWQYCGHAVDEDAPRPYCAYHAARFFTVTPRLTQTQRPIWKKRA